MSLRLWRAASLTSSSLTFLENGPNFLEEGRRIWFSEHSRFFFSQVLLAQLHTKAGASVTHTGRGPGLSGPPTGIPALAQLPAAVLGALATLSCLSSASLTPAPTHRQVRKACEAPGLPEELSEAVNGIPHPGAALSQDPAPFATSLLSPLCLFSGWPLWPSPAEQGRTHRSRAGGSWGLATSGQ